MDGTRRQFRARSPHGIDPRHVRKPQSAGWPAVLAFALLCGGTVAPARGQSDDLFTFDSRPPTLMVLFDGRVLHGQISERPGGYLIQAGDGQQVIPFEMIRLTARSLEEAYIKQRDALKKPTAGDHLQLARWCYEQQLRDGAAEQLEAALKLEDRTDARRLLQDVQAMTPPSRTPRDTRPAAGRGAATPAVTGTGLSTATHTDFVRRVQPILVNRCGNGACHGSGAKNEFRLASVRTGHRQQRRETEANLSAVLRQVDPQSPGESAILKQTAEAASVAHRGLFTGPGGAVQLERLRDWIHAAARDLGGPAVESEWDDNTSAFASEVEYAFGEGKFGAASNPPPNGQGAQQAGLETTGDIESPLLIEIPRAAVADAKPLEPSARPEAGRAHSSGKRAARSAGEQSEFLKKILEQDRPDAFDPKEFNRKVHGSAAGR